MTKQKQHKDLDCMPTASLNAYVIKKRKAGPGWCSYHYEYLLHHSTLSSNNGVADGPPLHLPHQHLVCHHQLLLDPPKAVLFLKASRQANSKILIIFNYETVIS